MVWKYEKIHIMDYRLMGLIILFILLFSVILGRLFYLQVLEGDRYKLLADKNRLSTRLTMPMRGNIYDRNGVPLSENTKTFQAVFVKEDAENYQNSLNNFFTLIPLDEEEKNRIQKEVRVKRAFMPVRLKDNLTQNEVILINLNMPDLSGVQIEEGMMRFYPAGQGNTAVLGYVSLLTEKDIASGKEDALLDLPGYRVGRTGIEGSQEEILKGEPGMRKSEVNAYGRTVRILDEVPAKTGQDIHLTIDSRLQNFASRLLSNYAASAVVINVQNGEIVAMVSAPAYDGNLFTSPISQKDWNALLNDSHRPLQNKPITGEYSPGSIFKLVVALAGLESGDITPNLKVNCRGKTKLGEHLFHCWKERGHGPLTLEEAIMHSCDVYFYEMAQKIGAEKILSTARRLGFGSAINIGIVGERSGLVPSDSWKQKRFGDSWRMGDTLNLSIGQGFLNATPVQIATAVARIAGGKNIQPTLLRDNVQENAEPVGFNLAHLKVVRQGMYDVVNKQGGTAFGSRINYHGNKMAGKTATTQVRRISLKERENGVISQKNLPEKYRDHAIFAAFAPTDKPKYAAVILVEHGGGGSSMAAPLMRELMQKVLELDERDSP